MAGKQITLEGARMVIHGDCVDELKKMSENSIDAIVTDPPDGLKFMGKEFDDLGEGAQQREWHKAWAKEALRVLKPGGHLIAFGGTRTYHHLATAIEEAGFEIRDQIQWLYGSGFPKSLNVSKAIDKSKGKKGGKKPDFLDLDKDGDKKESMIKAAKEKAEKAVKEDEKGKKGLTAGQKKLPEAMQKAILKKQNKK